MYYRTLNKGEWGKWRKALSYIEERCFKRGERTRISVFKELIDDIEPFTTIVRDGRKAVGYYMCAPLEDSGTDLKRWDKNYGKKNTVYIFSICVIPEYRNAGIGNEMMKRLLRDAYKKYSRITLHTRNDTFKKMCVVYGFRTYRQGVLEGEAGMHYMIKRLR